MKLVFAAVLAVGLAAIASPTVTDACPGKDKAAKEMASIDVATAAKLASSGKVIMVDANNPKTRSSQGVVPNARLLSSYSKYELSELNASKDDTLVFYCYNEQCGAAPAAAKVAKSNGFKTKVMDAGIIGWKKAGHATKKI